MAYGLLSPADREQAAYAGLLQLASGLMQGGAPSTNPGASMQGLGLGLGGFNQGYQGAINSRMQQALMGTQLAKAKREEETRKQLADAITGAQSDYMAQAPGMRSAFTSTLTEATDPGVMGLRGQARSAVDSAVGQAIPAQPSAAFLMQDPRVQAAFFRADPAAAMAAFQKQDNTVVIPEGGTLANRLTGKIIATGAPKADKLTEYDKLVADAQGNDPFRRQIARDILARRGQPMSVKVDNIGSIPPGYELVTLPDGTKRMQLIPGSPQADARGKQDERKEQTGSVVVQDIDRALDIINNKAMLPTTGMMGNWLSKVGGTAANDVRALLDSVKANAGFKELQAMRDASPTGGALGSITERELTLLQATIGSLEQNQTKEQLVDNMKRVKNVYLDIIHGPGNGPKREELKFQQKDAPKSDQKNPYADMTDQQVLDELRKQGLLK